MLVPVAAIYASLLALVGVVLQLLVAASISRSRNAPAIRRC